jgi:hypothetical protein
LLKNKNPNTINRHHTSSLISSNKKLLSIVVVSFIGGGNQNVQGKPPTLPQVTDKL